MSRAGKVLVALFVIGGLGALLAMCGRVSDRGRFALSYSTYGAGPDGARAAYELGLASGYDARRWNEDVAELPSPATLVAIGGCDHLQSRPMSRPEREALLRWIEAGGTWIVAGATEMLEHRSFGVRLHAPDEETCNEDDGLYGMILRADRRAREERRLREEEAEDADGETDPTTSPPALPLGESPPPTGTGVGADTYDDKPPPAEDPVDALARTLTGAERGPDEWAGAWEGPLAGMPMAGLRRSGFIEVDDDVPHEVLATVAGKSAIVVVPRGRGRIVVMTSGSAFQNRDLVSADGAPLFVRLLRLYAAEGPVLFDEYHLGAGEARSTMRYLFQRGAGPLVLHLLVILAIVLVRAGRRFAAPRRDVEPEAITTASFVSAVGALFSKVRDPRGSFRILARRAHARIAEHHHVDEVEPHRLERALRERKRIAAADAVRDIAALAEDGKRESLARATRELDEMTRKALTDGA